MNMNVGTIPAIQYDAMEEEVVSWHPISQDVTEKIELLRLPSTLERLREKELTIQTVFEQYCQPKNDDSGQQTMNSIQQSETWLKQACAGHKECLDLFLSKLRMIEIEAPEIFSNYKKELLQDCKKLDKVIYDLGTETLQIKQALVDTKSHQIFTQSNSTEVNDSEEKSKERTRLQDYNELSRLMMLNTFYQTVIAQAIRYPGQVLEIINQK